MTGKMEHNSKIPATSRTYTGKVMRGPLANSDASYSQREFLKSKKTATEILNVGVLIKSVFPDCECF